MGFWGPHHKRSRQYRKRERRQRDDSVQWNFLADRLEEPCIRKLLRVHRGRGRGHCVSAPASHIRHTPYRPADNACLDSTKSSPELTSRSSGRPIESDVLVPTVASCPREQRPRRSLQIHPGKSRWGFEPGVGTIHGIGHEPIPAVAAVWWAQLVGALPMYPHKH